MELQQNHDQVNLATLIVKIYPIDSHLHCVDLHRYSDFILPKIADILLTSVTLLKMIAKLITLKMTLQAVSS